MKNFTVKSGTWIRKVSIDDNIFDDARAEACTRVLEQLDKENELTVAMVMFCYETGHSDQSVTYNSYCMLSNAGLHKQAEYLRIYLYKQTKIDWAKEPMKNED